MSDASSGRLSGDEVRALRFAAHRQLARWANKPRLSPHQHARRNALQRAAAVLRNETFTRGCNLRASNTGRQE